jgi:hypothetical protein
MSITVNITETQTAVSTVENVAILDSALEDVTVATTTTSTSVGVAPYIIEGGIVGGGSPATLVASVSAGATSIATSAVSAEAVVGRYAIIEPFSLTAEIRRVASVAGTTVNLMSGSGGGGYGITTLQNSHAAGVSVYFVDSQAIPWEWWGGISTTGSDPGATVATNNVTGFNRLTQQLYSIGANIPIGVGTGTYWVNGELKQERAQGLIGVNPDSTIIKARTGFPFDSTGEVAIIHPVRDGTPVLYATAGVSHRWFIRNILIDGNNLPNSNGILASPQQPDHWENVRVYQCIGKYGICLTDVQQHIVKNLELTACSVGLRYRSCSFVWVDGLNIEQSTVADFIAEALPSGGAAGHNRFSNVHVEAETFTGKYFDIQDGDCWMFDNIWSTNADNASTLFDFNVSTGLSGNPIFQLENIRCNITSTSFKMVNDVQRGLSITSHTSVGGARRIIHKLISGAYTTAWEFLSTAANPGGGPIGYPTQLGHGFAVPEQASDHQTPPANTVFVYAKDNGSGKTQLVARFSTGAVQVITEDGLSAPAYTITNVTTDRSYDANATTIDELADTLGTLVADLRARALIS